MRDWNEEEEGGYSERDWVVCEHGNVMNFTALTSTLNTKFHINIERRY
jgi:hypothetical protein